MNNDYLTANKLAAISTACMSDTPVSMAASILPAGHALDTPAYRDAVRTVQKVIDLRQRLENIEKCLKDLSNDMHGDSSRPCPTCRPLSLALGWNFGCTETANRKAAQTLSAT